MVMYSKLYKVVVAVVGGSRIYSTSILNFKFAQFDHYSMSPDAKYKIVLAK